MISEGQRLQYLEAMGIQAWIGRDRVRAQATAQASVLASAQDLRKNDFLDQPEAGNPASPSKLSGETRDTQISTRPDSFEIGPGSGSILLLCTHQEDAATPLASDIARCLEEAPVWGWLTTDTGAAGVSQTALSLKRAIDERLFTRVLLFCADSNSGQPGNSEVLGSARIIYAPAFAELARSPAHKLALWRQLLTHGWCARRA